MAFPIGGRNRHARGRHNPSSTQGAGQISDWGAGAAGSPQGKHSSRRCLFQVTSASYVRPAAGLRRQSRACACSQDSFKSGRPVPAGELGVGQRRRWKRRKTKRNDAVGVFGRCSALLAGHISHQSMHGVSGPLSEASSGEGSFLSMVNIRHWDLRRMEPRDRIGDGNRSRFGIRSRFVVRFRPSRSRAGSPACAEARTVS